MEPVMSAECKSQMTTAGVPDEAQAAVMQAAGIMGISLADLLALAAKYGPAIYAFLQELIAKLNPPAPAK